MFKKPYQSKGRFGSKPAGRKFGGGGGSWNKGPRDGGFDRPAMHKATCAECGSACQVPFKPNGSKPIFCSNCFDRENGGSTKKFGGSRPERSFSTEKRMFKTECDDCGNQCEVPFRPNGSKPVYCKDCFGNSDAPAKRPSGNNANTDEQLKAINVKLDTILKALTPAE